MESSEYRSRPAKRLLNDQGGSERPRKKAVIEIEDDVGSEKVYKFRILLPNGSCIGVRIKELEFMDMPVKEFVEIVKEEYYRNLKQTERMEHKQKRRVNWNSPELHFIDVNDNVLRTLINFRKFTPNKDHNILRLHDGLKEADTYENMWDLTPDTELLMELPAEYTFETALADLIDNSLQAVWSNGFKERRLVSVELGDEMISIFDTGPGMDGTEENSIVKWGKMGASLNRSSRGEGIGGKPPYLTPVFGMFGYGGSIASMHLGSRALVSSKTKESKKVYTLHLQREALLSSSGSEKTWRTDGGIREPTKDETEESPHGSFTKVEIFEPRMKGLDPVQLQSRLKDIYFPYIQCDKSSKAGTITPIEFEVNGTNLAEIAGGEVAITNLESCNGPNFILQLHFRQNGQAANSQGARPSQKANASLKFVYFPQVKGKESIVTILEKLKEDGHKTTETFDTFSRVSIRRLGRLLPDARWHMLPFMKPKQRVGDKAHILKRCCPRVKCFIDTDAGFNPTPSKTDLAHHHLYTTALKNFGDKPLDKDMGDVNFSIHKDGKQLTLTQLEKQYQEWILEMHVQYDREVERGEDEAVLILSPPNKKKLHVSSDVLRVHEVIPRKGVSWKSGQKLKLLKGAGAGVHKQNVHATLEYILLEGFEGDAGGDARLICRPLAVPEEKGCKLIFDDDGSTKIDIGDSLSLPISVIDKDMCVALDEAEWDKEVEKQCQKQASAIDLLSLSDCTELGIDGALPSDSTVYAGHTSPKEIVAVVRPASFHSGSSKTLEQKYIVRDDFEMLLQLKYSRTCKSKDHHIYSGSIRQSSHKGVHGLYVFPVGSKSPDIFKKAGIYTFSLSLRGSRCATLERSIKVEALSEVMSWECLTDVTSPPFIARVGTCLPPVSIACYDAFKNRIAFPAVPQIKVEVTSGERLLDVIDGTQLEMSSDKLTLSIKNILVESNDLDCIRPSYDCTLVVSSRNEELSAMIPCQVVPGDYGSLTVQPTNLDKELVSGQIIDELIFEMFDGYGNHAREGLEVSLSLNGFCLVDHIGLIRKVDRHGRIDLSGLLKATGGYGSKVSLSIFLDEDIIFEKHFKIEERKLRIASMVNQTYFAGSKLENTAFEIVNSEGQVDESIHDDEKCGQSHTLTIKSDSPDADDSVKYSFRHGCCTIRVISLPQNEGIVCFTASHSRYPELCVTFKVNLLKAPDLEPEVDTFQQSYTQNLLLPNSPALKIPKLEDQNSCSQFSGGSPLVHLDSSTLKESAHNLMDSNVMTIQGFKKDCVKCATAIDNYEKQWEELSTECSKLETQISSLQDSLGPVSIDDSGCALGIEQMSELIRSKEDTASSLICKILGGDVKDMVQEDFKSNILGVVALLGTVQRYSLSRILSEYVGEDHMLALVCKSYSRFKMFETDDQNGDMDLSFTLDAMAASAGGTITGRYLVLSLEDIRPYTEVIRNDPQRILALPNPTLPSGKTPLGFIGYAVNLIDIDADHMDFRTKSGHGLRETLFYRLFGELQVYETRAAMHMAKTCIRSGAVSLDGGVIRDGILSLGQLQIHFPVVSPGGETHHSHNLEILKNIESKKLELRSKRAEIEKKSKKIKKLKKRLHEKESIYEKFLDNNGQFLNNLLQISNGKNSSA